MHGLCIKQQQELIIESVWRQAETGQHKDVCRTCIAPCSKWQQGLMMESV